MPATWSVRAVSEVVQPFFQDGKGGGCGLFPDYIGGYESVLLPTTCGQFAGECLAVSRGLDKQNVSAC